VDRAVSERRAKAFTAGTIHGTSHGSGDAAARFYAAEAAKVLMAYFHAAALTGKTLDDLLGWVAKQLSTSQPEEILRRHPHSDPLWEVSDLVGRVRVPRSSWQMGGGRGRTIHSEEIPILRPEELRQLPDKQALVIAENARPIIARLHRCIEGRDGQRLLSQQRALREQLAAGHAGVRDVEARTAAALVEAQRHGW